MSDCDPLDCSMPGSSVLGYSRQEYWSGLPCPPPGDLPNPGIKLASLSLLLWQAGSLPLGPRGKPTISFGTHQILYLEYFFSGVTTSILGLELSPNSLFHFLEVPYLVFCLRHKRIWCHRGSELSGWALWLFLWISHTLCHIGYAKNTRPCLLFHLGHFSRVVFATSSIEAWS